MLVAEALQPNKTKEKSNFLSLITVSIFAGDSYAFKNVDAKQQNVRAASTDIV